LDKTYFLTCNELKNMNDQDISDFITRNKISFEEVDYNIELSFVFSNIDTDEEYVDLIFPGDIKGKLLYDKTTGEFIEFNYQIQYLAESVDEESENVKTMKMVFECSGKTAREQMGDMWIPDNPTVYSDVIEFLEDVSDQVIPPDIYR
jgi:hypothetical protein